VYEVGDEVGDEIAGRAVRPLEILEHQEHGAPLGQVDDQLVQQVEELHGQTDAHAVAVRVR
jgi:hypothetical protein